MNIIQSSKLKMYGAVKLVLDHHQEVWAKLVAFAKAVTDFNGGIQQIKSLEQSRNGGTKGATADKHTARDVLTATATKVAGAVRAYAASINSGELRARVDYTPSRYQLARDTEALTICQGIYETANGINGDLKDFGITTQVLKDFLDKLNAYTDAIGRPRETASNNRASSELMEETFQSLDSLLADQLDGLMEQFRKDDPAFYAAYTAAREVVKFAGGHAGSNAADGGNGTNGGNTENGENQTPIPPTAATVEPAVTAP